MYAKHDECAKILNRTGNSPLRSARAEDLMQALSAACRFVKRSCRHPGTLAWLCYHSAFRTSDEDRERRVSVPVC